MNGDPNTERGHGGACVGILVEMQVVLRDLIEVKKTGES